MQYILIIESETTGNITCVIRGLPREDAILLVNDLNKLQIHHMDLKEGFEADVQGIQLINMLGKPSFVYRVCGQSMLIEKAFVGGRTILTQKIAWTLNKE